MTEKHLLKKNTVFNKIVPDFMDTLYYIGSSTTNFDPPVQSKLQGV